MPKADALMILWQHGAGLRCIVRACPRGARDTQSKLELRLVSSSRVLRRRLFTEFCALREEAERWRLEYLGPLLNDEALGTT